MIKARINGTVMPVVFNGCNIVIALDPSVDKADQRVSFERKNNDITMTENTKFTKKKRRRIKVSPFLTVLK